MEILTDINFTRYLLGTALTLCLLVGFVLLLNIIKQKKWLTPKSATKRFIVQETLTIAPKHTLYIIKQDNLEHTLLLTPTGSTHLGTMPMPHNTTAQGANTYPTEANSIGFLKNLADAVIAPKKAPKPRKKPQKKGKKAS